MSLPLVEYEERKNRKNDKGICLDFLPVLKYLVMFFLCLLLLLLPMLLVLILIEICGTHSLGNVWWYYVTYVGFTLSFMLPWSLFHFFPFFEDVVVTLLGSLEDDSESSHFSPSFDIFVFSIIRLESSSSWNDCKAFLPDSRIFDLPKIFDNGFSSACYRSCFPFFCYLIEIYCMHSLCNIWWGLHHVCYYHFLFPGVYMPLQSPFFFLFFPFFPSLGNFILFRFIWRWYRKFSFVSFIFRKSFVMVGRP